MTHFQSLNPSIICISETKFDKKKEKQFRNIYGSEYRCFFSNYMSNSRGVALLIDKKFPIKICNSTADDQGRFVIVQAEINSKNVLFASIYGPNDDDPDFLEHMFETIFNLNPEHVCIAGDFNTGPSEILDYSNYVNVSHKNARSKLIESLDSYNMCDAYRFKNDTKIEYTWEADGLRPQKSRIDLCLISNNLQPFIKDSKILNAYLSDHCIVVNDFDFLNIRRGKGFWRLDNEFLNDNEYVSRVTKTISLTLAKYVKFGNYNNLLEEGTMEEINDFCKLDPVMQQGFDYSIDPNLMIEMIINDLRMESISYISAYKKAKNNRANYIKSMIEYYRKKQTLSDMEKLLYNDFILEYDSIIEAKNYEKG